MGQIPISRIAPQRIPEILSPEELAQRVYEAYELLVELDKTNHDSAVELGMQLDSDPRSVNFVIREAKRGLGELTQVEPRRSGNIVGASRFRPNAVDRCAVSLGKACDQLARLSHAEFAALQRAEQTTGSDFRGEVLFPNVVKGVREMLG
ncbi:MAG: hypothetical protein HYY44_08990 [Deltaproteobacteria bacterium]|nr:hypothetical protein [Deltaproteobacteria bacterium]